jgi:hypothetical protein
VWFVDLWMAIHGVTVTDRHSLTLMYVIVDKTGVRTTILTIDAYSSVDVQSARRVESSHEQEPVPA